MRGAGGSTGMPVMSRRPAKGAKRPERDSGLAPGRRSLGRAGFRRGGGTEHAGAGAPIRWRTMEGGWPEVNGVAGVAAAARTTATRRRFTAEHKVRIVAEAGKCTERGAIGRLLEREGLFASRLSAWRKQAREGALQALGGKRGPKPRPAEEKALEGGGPETPTGETPGCAVGCSRRTPSPSARRSAAGARRDKAPGVGGGREDRQRPRRGGGHRTGVRSPRRLPLDVLPPPGASERIAASASCPAAGAVGGGTQGGLLTCCARSASWTALRRRSSRRCSTRACICARSARCTGSWPRIVPSASAGPSGAIPTTRSPRWRPGDPTRPGRGTSPGSPEPRRGPSTTCTSSSTSTAATSPAGWSPTASPAALGERLIAETCAREGVLPDALTLHSDRGSPMTSAGVAQLLAVPRRRSLLLPAPRLERQPLLRVPNSRPSSTTPASPPRSAPSMKPGTTAAASSAGTTTSTATAASPCSPPRRSTLARRPASSPAGTGSSPPPTPPVPDRFVNGQPANPELPPVVWINPPLPVTVVDTGSGGESSPQETLP